MSKRQKKQSPQKKGYDKVYNKKPNRLGKIFVWIMLILLVSSVVLSLGFSLYSYFMA